MHVQMQDEGGVEEEGREAGRQINQTGTESQNRPKTTNWEHTDWLTSTGTQRRQMHETYE
jgi:hypothetical protein